MSTNSRFSYSFVIATVGIAALSLLPQAVLFVRNDTMGMICTLYYVLFVSRYASVSKVFSILKGVVPLLLLLWLVHSGDFKYGFILPGLTIWTLLLPCFAIVAVIRRKNQKEQKMILWGNFLILAYISYNTLIALATDPDVMRVNEGFSAIDITDKPTKLRMQGIGNYGYAYSMGALFVALYSIRKNVAQRNSKIIIYAYLVFCAFVVVASQYATLLFITFFSVFFCMALNADTFVKKNQVIFLGIIVYYSFQTIILLGSSLFEGQTLGGKFQMIYDGIWGSNDLEHISADRSEKQLNAFLTFLDSPLIGNSLYENGVGQTIANAHSTFFSVLAQTGLIGLLSYLMTFYKALRFQISQILEESQTKAYRSVIAFYAFFALFNTIDYSFECSWTIFFLIPLIYYYFTNKNK